MTFARYASAVPLALLLVSAGPAEAQYKVIGADGTVTYTDRPAAAPGSKVTQLRKDASVAAAQAPLPASANTNLARLPYELRQVAERFAVVLYASADCAPCDAGRRMLSQRGIPYTERLIQSDEDQQALARISGARTLPTLAVGSQLSRGWMQSEWSANLDLAGYPSQSRLPGDWPVAVAAPLASRAASETVPNLPPNLPPRLPPDLPPKQPTVAAPAQDNAPGSVRF